MRQSPPGMRVLLVRPVSPNERFGLGPFFKVEPLGLEYVAQALLAAGHEVELVDLRFAGSLASHLRRFRPGLVGVASMHAVDIPAAIDVAHEVKRWDASVFTLVGGHAAAVYPGPLLLRDVDAICVGDGELSVAELVDALGRGGDVGEVAGLVVRREPGDGPEAFERTPTPEMRIDLDRIPVPAHHLVDRFRRHYLCVHKTPLWAVETTRGCPYRCSFCSIWKHHDRTFRVRGIDAVCRDLAVVGDNVFVVDDLFWHPAARSLELGRELRRRGIKKEWMLVQARLDTVARHASLLEAWRPLAGQIDIFFGFESPRDDQLQALDKDMTSDAVEEGIRVARSLGYGVTGNFVVDPDWDEADFEAMWDMVDRLELNRSGYTILTPLPGTPLFEAQESRLVEHDLSRYDMHHILFEPKLGRQKFFELFVKSWRRNVLSRDHSASKWWRWFRQLNLAQAVALVRILYHTQRMLNVDAYLAESFPLQMPAGVEAGR